MSARSDLSTAAVAFVSRSAITRWAALAGLDAAAVFALAGRSWYLLAAPVTLLVIASQFSPSTQGYYYTFASVLALQSFAELGLSIVIVNLASHEWVHLSLDERGCLQGPSNALSRLVGFGRQVFTWYAAASLLFVVGVGAAGYLLFAADESGGVAWRGPWLFLVALAGLQLWLLSCTAILEGCNQVAVVQRFRLIQAVAGTGMFWVVALSGGGLWAAVAMASVRLATDLYLVAVRYRMFFRSFLARARGPVMEWRAEVWPMQWRLGMSGIVNYFSSSLFNPVMFHYHGASVAGRLGMTMQIVGGLQSLAVVLVSTRVPRFGMLVARRDYRELDRMWARTSISSVALLVVSGLVLLGSIVVLTRWGVPLADRMLDLRQTAMLLLAAVLMQVSLCETAYMRAHRLEPIVVLSVTTSLASGLLIWLVGKRLGSGGAIASYLSVVAVFVVCETVIWRRFRARAVAQVVAQ